MCRLIIAYDVHTSLPYSLHIIQSLRKYINFLNYEFATSEFNERVIEQLELELKY